jgi:hypothetical protein
VHLVPRVGQIQVEIQIRTELQDSWAQIFERLADRWGRGIRYGLDPENPEARVRSGEASYSRRESVQSLMELSDSIFDLEQLRQQINKIARQGAEIESGFSGMRDRLNPDVLGSVIAPNMIEFHEGIVDFITSEHEDLINAECRELLNMGNYVSLDQSIRLGELLSSFVQHDLDKAVAGLASHERDVRARLSLVANAVDEGG